jgi:hypothetical protein
MVHDQSCDARENDRRDNALDASGRSTEKLCADLPAFAPNHFVRGLFAREAQDKFVGHFKISRSAEAHAATGASHNEAIVRCRARFGQDVRDLPEWPAPRVTSIPNCDPDHPAT